LQKCDTLILRKPGNQCRQIVGRQSLISIDKERPILLNDPLERIIKVPSFEALVAGASYTLAPARVGRAEFLDHPLVPRRPAVIKDKDTEILVVLVQARFTACAVEVVTRGIEDSYSRPFVVWRLSWRHASAE